MLSLEFPFFFANVCLHIQYDFVMSDQNFILTFLVLALRVIARFSYDVVNRWNERWLGNITSATDHELWRCKGMQEKCPISHRLPFRVWKKGPNPVFPLLFWRLIPHPEFLSKYRFVCQNRIPSQNFGESLFQASGQFPYPVKKILFVPRILHSILVKSSIPKRLFQTKKWVAQSQNHAAWYKKISSVRKWCFKK